MEVLKIVELEDKKDTYIQPAVRRTETACRDCESADDRPGASPLRRGDKCPGSADDRVDLKAFKADQPGDGRHDPSHHTPDAGRSDDLQQGSRHGERKDRGIRKCS